MPQLTPLEPWIGKTTGKNPLTQAELEAYQVQNLRETLDLVRQNSQFYRSRLAGSPAEINSLSDLQKFPFTTAEDIRLHPLQFLCVSQGEIQRVVTLQTSGTTGASKRLYFTQADQELTIDFFQHGMATFTRPGDRVLICLPGERPGSVGDLLGIALVRLGAHPIQYGLIREPMADAARLKDMALEIRREERQEAQLQHAAEAKRPVDVLVGIPTQILSLSRVWQQIHANPNRGPRAVLLSTDHVPEAIKKTLEETWACTVFNHYGMTEMGLGGGVECQARRGYHLREADLFFEIIDPRTGALAAEGEEGEIVFTTLTRRGMPLIRYRTGDLSRFLRAPCPCGAVLKTLEKVRCRVNGRIPLRGGFLTLPELDERLFSIPGVLDFSVEVLSEGNRDILEIQVKEQEAGEVSPHVLEERLGQIKSIARSQQEKGLEIRISTRTQAASNGVGTAKRQIIDRRR
jgi:phenylacetate-coenzyme A ligase PaaK-like adenylate-forming protein